MCFSIPPEVPKFLKFGVLPVSTSISPAQQVYFSDIILLFYLNILYFQRLITCRCYYESILSHFLSVSFIRITSALNYSLPSMISQIPHPSLSHLQCCYYVFWLSNLCSIHCLLYFISNFHMIFHVFVHILSNYLYWKLMSPEVLHYVTAL